VDLKDTPPGIIADCEDFTRAAVDQHPAVQISHHLKLLTEEHELLVRLACPRLSPEPVCKGKLSARSVGGGGGDAEAGGNSPRRFLAAHRYRIRSGQSRVVRLALAPGEVNRILDTKRIRLTARELDPLGRLKLSARDCAIGKSACRIRVP
jgi:hypothetical protein